MAKEAEASAEKVEKDVWRKTRRRLAGLMVSTEGDEEGENLPGGLRIEPDTLMDLFRDREIELKRSG